MRPRLAVALLLVLLPVVAHAAEWLTDRDAAIARARAEKKPIVGLVLSQSCAECNERAEDFVSELEKQDFIDAALDSFVLLKGTLGRVRPPGMILLDPNGSFVIDSQAFGDIKRTTEFLVAARDAAPAIIDSATLREEGKETAAEFALAYGFMAMHSYKRAAKEFRSVATKLRDSDPDGALLATANAGLAIYRSGNRLLGRTTIENANRSKKPSVAAEIWWIVGMIEAMESHRDEAKSAWRKASDLAPEGSGIEARARRSLEGIDASLLPPKSNVQTSMVEIRVPTKRILTGDVQVEAIARDAAAVQFYLDDVPVARANHAPFRATIDVGRTPAPRTVKAVAVDRGGAPVAQAVKTINDRADALRIAITSPAAATASGDVVIEAAPDVPAGEALRSVQLYWNEKLLGTFEHPPFRLTTRIDGEFGYIRAVAALVDGTTAEAVKLLNASTSAASIDVQGVTFSAVVTDSRGERVKGLTASDFIVEEDGVIVPAAVRSSEDEPALIGFAIDVSSSMEPEILRALTIGDRFIESGASLHDRMFIVAFDLVPRLVQKSTDDPSLLRSAVKKLRPGGGTSIWDGVIFALQQFQDTAGKRALVVLSDGKDMFSSRSIEACTRMAQTTGIPIYALAMSTTVPGNPLGELAKTTGGLFVPLPRLQDAPVLFARLRDEVRGQYLITFPSPKSGGSGSWRTLKVKAKGYNVRTLAGYRVR